MPFWSREQEGLSVMISKLWLSTVCLKHRLLWARLECSRFLSPGLPESWHYVGLKSDCGQGIVFCRSQLYSLLSFGFVLFCSGREQSNKKDLKSLKNSAKLL